MGNSDGGLPDVAKLRFNIQRPNGGNCLLRVAVFLAILNAARSRDNRPSVLKALFGSLTAITGTWTTIGIILVLPVLISWLSGLSDVLLDVGAGGAIFSACLSMLLVLVTLEFSELNSLNDRNRDDWRGLLLFALALDLLCVVLLVWPIKVRAYEGQQPGQQPDWSGVLN